MSYKHGVHGQTDRFRLGYAIKVVIKADFALLTAFTFSEVSSNDLSFRVIPNVHQNDNDRPSESQSAFRHRMSYRIVGTYRIESSESQFRSARAYERTRTTTKRTPVSALYLQNAVQIQQCCRL